MDHALELKAWADNESDDERAMAMRLGAAEIERLRNLLLKGLAIHGAEAHTHSEKEWREEARAALGINR